MNDAEILALSPKSPKKFNQWRRNNNYPMKWKSFVDYLPLFSEWINEQMIDKDIVVWKR